MIRAGKDKACEARCGQGMIRVGQAKARQVNVVIVTRLWLNNLKVKCWTRGTIEEITPHWKVGRGRTSAYVS
ncbi:hypothetical protein KY289_030322 [Solanum tuberosum]|nr:hypothetical protein KY289_030322 [Solanum tuberosum]